MGTWTGTPPITYSYQWLRCGAEGSGCSDISGATSSTYTIASADLGHSLEVTVTAKGSVGST